jgi:hypothetical protein
MPTIDLNITLVSAMHIGAGDTSPEGAARIVRDARGRPCIPASTLKGAHRAAVEQIAAALGLPVCEAPLANRMCYPLGGKAACVVCQIFGSPWLPGKVFYRDLTANVTPVIDRRVLGQVSRCRGTRIGSHDVNREVLPAGTVFSGKTDHQVADPALLALVLCGLRAIPALGSGQSAGGGLIVVEAKALDATRHAVNESDLADALRRLQQAQQTSQQGQQNP